MSNELGFPEANVGAILQRGGEELILEKVSNRFTISLTSTAQQLPATLLSFEHQPILHSLLEEVRVPSANLESVMATARANDTIAFASHVYQLQSSPQTLIYLTDELTIQFAPHIDQQLQQTIAAQFALEQLKPVVGIENTFVYRLTAQSQENPLKIANRLSSQPEILTAEVNIICQQESYYRPSDDSYNQQWYLNHSGGTLLAAGSHIDAEQAWNITRGARSVVVAIMDDAVDTNHPDFQGEGKIVAPRDFKDRDFLPLPTSSQESHGTACAGVAVAEETGTGVVGVAPDCALMPIRTTGSLSDTTVEEMFNWAMEHGADVISCSWGAAAVYFPLSLRQKAAINRAATEGRDGKGCVIVFASGNANRPINGTIYERGWMQNVLSGSTQWLNGFAVHPDVIAVSACTSLSRKSAYSNWGSNISVCAPSNNAPPGMWFRQTGFIATAPPVRSFLPGRGIFTTDQLGQLGYNPGDFTRDFGGTSSACPVVAGVAALVLSANPDLSAQQVRSVLQQSTDKIIDPDPDPQLGLRMGNYGNNGHSLWFGYGKVNAHKAVQMAKQLLVSGGAIARTIEGHNDSSMRIPDHDDQGITSTISITQTAKIQDIKVTLTIEHEFLGDIEIRLIAPTGKTILLQNRTLGAAKQLQATYYLETTPALRHLLQQNTRGTWRLWVVDLAPEDTGQLYNWHLTLGI